MSRNSRMGNDPPAAGGSEVESVLSEAAAHVSAVWEIARRAIEEADPEAVARVVQTPTKTEIVMMMKQMSRKVRKGMNKRSGNKMRKASSKCPPSTERCDSKPAMGSCCDETENEGSR